MSWSRLVSDDKPKWDMPTNVVSSKLDQAGELAKKHGISPDRAQMLIDRYGDDQEQLDKAAKGAKINPSRHQEAAASYRSSIRTL